jgi:F420-non-reducing hydrogenase large subunit
MATLVFPLSRIEGHARVIIEVQDGQAVAARLEATEFRGFEYFVRGVPAEQMPVIAPRICGVCSTAHHVAAVKALEDAYGVTPPPLARTLRELLLLGQLIQNQATSLFIFTMPDRLGLTSIFQNATGGNASDHVGARALRVRKAGTDLISLAGGQFIHPIKAVVGGVTSGIAPVDAEKMHVELSEALPVACALFDHYWETSLALRERIGTWGDDEPTHYIAATTGECPNYDADSIRVMCPTGEVCAEFPARESHSQLTAADTQYSYAGQTTYQGHIVRANSLGRINLASRLGTHRADEYLKRFQEAFGRPAHAILLYDLCRGIELVYGLERALEILSQSLDYEDTDVPYTPRDGDGWGLVEAPRGPLVHHYRIEGGRISQAEFVIPTVHNSLAMERALLVAARRYINSERMNWELEHAVGRVVRAFDPCIACATH